MSRGLSSWEYEFIFGKRYNYDRNPKAEPDPNSNFEFEDEYTIRNWNSGIVHAAKPIWKSWQEVPEDEKPKTYRGRRAFKVDYYISPCTSTESSGHTFFYAGQLRTYVLSKRPVTCKRCLKIINSQKQRR